MLESHTVDLSRGLFGTMERPKSDWKRTVVPESTGKRTSIPVSWGQFPRPRRLFVTRSRVWVQTISFSGGIPNGQQAVARGLLRRVPASSAHGAGRHAPSPFFAKRARFRKKERARAVGRPSSLSLSLSLSLEKSTGRDECVVWCWGRPCLFVCIY